MVQSAPNQQPPSDMEAYPSRISIPVQWGDMDALGHVNNVVHFRWYESSRISYLEQSGMAAVLKEQGVGPILAAASSNYTRQLHYPDNVQIGCRVSRIGRSSMTLQHLVFSQQQEDAVANGESVVVVFDFDKQRPIRIPADVRELLKSYQQDLPEE